MTLSSYALRILALWLIACVSLAQEDAPPPPDVRMVIDVSGSMKQNDPSNLRQPAVDLLLQLLPDNSKAGVWTFGQYVNMLIPHKVVDESWKQQAQKNAEDINSLGLHTNIGAALEKAAYDSDRLSPDYRSSLVLLTDGMVDVDRNPSVNEGEWRRIVDDVLPALKDAGYTIHTIALSDNADKALLEKMAISTGGMFEVAQSADELMKIFLRVFDNAAPAERVPLEGNTFLIDSSIEEFTALIFRQSDQPTQLIGPDQTQYDAGSTDRDLNWYRTDQYDLITVRRPLEGEWRVIADMDPDSRVTVVSNLNMRVKPLPSNLSINDTAELSVLFQEQKQTVKDPRFLSLLSVNSLVQNVDTLESWPAAMSGSVPPANGVFQRELDMFAEEGTYQIVVQVDGKSFQRQFSQQVTVRAAFSVEMEEQIKDGREARLIRVRAHSDNLEPADMQVVARIRNPKGRSSLMPMLLQPNEEWQLEITPEEQGRYEVQVRVSGVDRAGKPVMYDSELQTFSYPSTDDPFSEPASVVEPQQQEVAVEEPEVTEDNTEEAEPAEEKSSVPLYIGLALGNIVILALAYFAYRMIMGSGKDDSLKELQEATDKATEEAASAVEAPPPPPAPVEPEPEPFEEPEMAALDEDSLEQDEPQPEEAGDVEAIEMDDGLDLADDDIDSIEIAAQPGAGASTQEDVAVDEADAPEEESSDTDIDELLKGLEEPEEDGDESDVSLFDEEAPEESEEDPEDFSMDDFSADVFDDEEDDEKDK